MSRMEWCPAQDSRCLVLVCVTFSTRNILAEKRNAQRTLWRGPMGEEWRNGTRSCWVDHRAHSLSHTSTRTFFSSMKLVSVILLVPKQKTSKNIFSRFTLCFFWSFFFSLHARCVHSNSNNSVKRLCSSSVGLFLWAFRGKNYFGTKKKCSRSVVKGNRTKSNFCSKKNGIEDECLGQTATELD